MPKREGNDKKIEVLTEIAKDTEDDASAGRRRRMSEVESSWAAFWSPIVNDWIFVNAPDEGYVVYTAANPLDPFPVARLQAFVRNAVGEMEEVPGVTTAVGEFMLDNGSVWRAAVDLHGIGMYDVHMRLVESE